MDDGDTTPEPTDDGDTDGEGDGTGDTDQPAEQTPNPPAPGATVWLQRAGTSQDDLALDSALDANGDILTLTAQGLDDLQAREPTDDRVQLVLTRYSPAGERRGSQVFEVYTPDTPSSLHAQVRAHVATDAAGHVVLAGDVVGTLDLGTVKLGTGGFIVRMDAAGTVLWSSNPQAEGLSVADLAVDAAGRAVVAFNAPRSADFGNGVRGSGALVVTYTADGQAEGSVSVGRPEEAEGAVRLTALTLDGAGRMAVGGQYTGAVRFGTHRSGSARNGSPFVALYQDGVLAWTRTLASTSGTLLGVGLDGQGTVVAAGSFSGDFSWAGTRLQGAPSRTSPFLLSADAEGKERWGRNLGDSLQAGSLAVTPSGEVVLTGFTYSLIEDGAAGNEGLGNSLPVTLRYGADGGVLATRLFISDPPEARGELYGVESFASVLLMPDGDAVLFGHTDRDTDFGTGHRAPGRADTFLLRLKR